MVYGSIIQIIRLIDWSFSKKKVPFMLATILLGMHMTANIYIIY